MSIEVLACGIRGEVGNVVDQRLLDVAPVFRTEERGWSSGFYGVGLDGGD